MPVAKAMEQQPEKLKPYIQLGLDLTWKASDKEAVADCPFCGRENKLTIDIKEGVYRCLVCAEGSDKGGGNARIFLRLFQALCFDNTSSEDYRELALDRNILDTTLIRFGVCKNILTGDWLVPGYGVDGRLNTLYRYKIGGLLYAMSDMGQQLFMTSSGISSTASTLYVSEGPWDTMAAWELLESCEEIVGVPGAGTFREEWAKAEMFQDKDVVLCFDSDQPRRLNTGKMQMGAGFTGSKRTAELLSSYVEAERLFWLKWSENGYDPDLPDGYDLRDCFNAAGNAREQRVAAFEQLKGRVELVPTEWIRAEPTSGEEHQKKELQPIECESYSTLIDAWKQAMHWTDGLDCALSVMLAAALSTKQVGEQLWIKIISPPSTGKTTLVEGLSVARKYTLSKDTIRGFFSGWRGEGADMSIAALAYGKTLITKDGDTLLKAPNLSQILSEGRGLYDGAGRTHYRNSVMPDYEGHRMTWLLCGTSALREIDDSELGSRFLDCVIMDGIDEDFEDEVGMKAVQQEAMNVRRESNGVPEDRHNHDLTKAMQLTGGYVVHLRKNAIDLLEGVYVDNDTMVFCNNLGAFTARMRARPSKTQTEEATREFSARLSKQFMRLCLTMAVVMNKKRVDDEVRRRVNKVARDTSRGITLEIAKHLYEANNDGMTASSIAVLMGSTDVKINSLLRYLRGISTVRSFKKVSKKGQTTGGTKWRLAPRMRLLYRRVILNDYTDEEE